MIRFNKLLQINYFLSIFICTYISIDYILNLFMVKKSKKNKYKINDKMFYQMNQIIMKEGNIDKDIYSRKISSKVVKKFCKFSIKYGYNLNNLTSEQFDHLYKLYVNYQIKKSNYHI